MRSIGKAAPLLGALALLMLSPAGPPEAHGHVPAWLDPAWKYRRALSVDVQRLASPAAYRLRLVLDGSAVDLARLQPGGADLRFTSSDGRTLLPHWIERFGDDEGVVHVRLPAVVWWPYARLYMYYGNSRAGSTSSLPATFSSFDYASTYSNGTVVSTPAYEAFAGSARLRNGDILVTYRSASSHVAADGRLMVARSRDQGDTWTHQLLYDDPRLDDRSHVGITQLANGTLMVPIFGYDAANNVVHDGQLITSVDNGYTWQAPSLVASPFGEPVIPYGRIMELADGTLLLAGYGRHTEESSRVVLLQSSDGGAHWGLRSTIGYLPGSDATEPAVLRLGGGQYLAVFRVQDPRADRLLQTTSEDGGLSWAPARPLSSLRYGVSPDLLRLASGDVLLAYGARPAEGASGAGSMPFGIFAALSKDRGATWSSRIPIYHGHDSDVPADLGYPGSFQFDSGAIFTAFNASRGGNGIHRSIWTVEDRASQSTDFDDGDEARYALRGPGTGFSADLARGPGRSLRLQDLDPDRLSRAGITTFHRPQVTGSVTFWIYPETGAGLFALVDGERRRFAFRVDEGGVLRSHDGTAYVELPVPTLLPRRQWSKISLAFNTVTGQTRVRVDDRDRGVVGASVPGYAIAGVELASASAQGRGDTFYVDDLAAQVMGDPDLPVAIAPQEDRLSARVSLAFIPLALGGPGRDR
jgi:hypothetical protein